MFVLLLLCLGSGVHAQKRSLPALARKQADSLARKQVIYNDRVVPFNTLARDFVLKLTGKPSYGGMTPEQVIMFLVATDGVENLEQHGYSVAGDFLTATTA